MWAVDLVAGLLWVWALLDYLSVVHVSVGNYSSTFDVGVFYDTRDGRSRVTCVEPCDAACVGAQWAGAGSLALLVCTATASRWGQWRSADLMRVGALLGMISVAALELHMSSDECSPRSLPPTARTEISLQRARIPLAVATVAVACTACRLYEKL
jgi:hypothetical protein